jgi:hypothetical protein
MTDPITSGRGGRRVGLSPTERGAFAGRTPKDDIHSLSLGYRFLGRATLCRTLPHKTFDFYQYIFFTFV